MATAAEIKKALREAGFEVYRTRGDVVPILADRVRENLLMDAGTFLPRRPGAASRSGVRGPGPAHRLPQRRRGPPLRAAPARRRPRPVLERGYARGRRREVRKILDPGDGQRTLDTWCEVSFEKETGDLDAAIAEVRFALALEKRRAAPSRLV